MFKYLIVMSMLCIATTQAVIVLPSSSRYGVSEAEYRRELREANADYLMQEQVRLQKEMLNEYRQKNYFNRYGR